MLIVLAASGLGIMLLRLAKSKKQAPDILEIPIGISLGLGAFGYLSDLIYMLQIVSMKHAYLLLSFTGLICFSLSFNYIKSLLKSQSIPKSENPTILDYVFRISGWLIIVLFCLGLYIQNVVPVNDNDSLVHYGFLSKMIAGGVTFDDMLLLRNMPITDLNRLIPMIYGSGYAIMGSSGAHLMNFVFVISILLLIHLCCVVYVKATDLWNPLPILIALTIRELVFSATTSKVDYGVAMLIVASVVAILNYRSRALWILSILFGLTICSRTNAIFVVFVMLLIFFAAASSEYIKNASSSKLKTKAAFESIKATGHIGLGAVIIAAPPYFIHYLIYGNPLFPFLNGKLGNYEHVYDYIVFNFLRYKVHGFLGPILIYGQLLVQQYKNFLHGLGQFGLGLSPFFALAPFAISRKPKRQNMILLSFFILGYLAWAIYSSHTHRSLLGVAFIGVILISIVLGKLKKLKMIYVPLCLLVLWSAYGTAARLSIDHFPNKGTYVVPYFLGQIDIDKFYQDRILRANPSYYSPKIDDVREIMKRTDGFNLTCVNVYPQLHPDVINVFRFDLPKEDMRTRLSHPDIEELDRYIFTKITSDSYLQNEYDQFSKEIWPTNGVIQKPKNRREAWKLVRKFQDTQYHIMDAVLKSPEKIINIMKLHDSRYLVTHKTDDYLHFADVPELKLIWQSEEINLFEII
jgi:hypothetical protein